MGKILRLLVQVLLVGAVGFFGYHYFTREELRGCISTPLASLAGKTGRVELDEQKVDQFVEKLGEGLSAVASKGAGLAEKLKAVEQEEGSEGVLDKGQYLYCKAVVEKVEESN
jgi:hypothetical protein